MDKTLTPEECRFEWREALETTRVYLQPFIRALDLLRPNYAYRIEASICEAQDHTPYYCIDLFVSHKEFYPNEGKLVTSFTRFTEKKGELTTDDLCAMFMAHSIKVMKRDHYF